MLMYHENAVCRMLELADRKDIPEAIVKHVEKAEELYKKLNHQCEFPYNILAGIVAGAPEAKAEPPEPVEVAQKIGVATEAAEVF